MTPEAQPQAVLPVVSPTKANAENALDGTMPAVFGTYTSTVIALVIAVSIGADLMSDISEGRSGPHMIGMVLGTGLSLVSLVVMWRLMHAYGARAQSLKVMLDSTRTDLVTSRAKTSDILQGLGVLLDRQFAEWSLSPAECGDRAAPPEGALVQGHRGGAEHERANRPAAVARDLSQGRCHGARRAFRLLLRGHAPDARPAHARAAPAECGHPSQVAFRAPLPFVPRLPDTRRRCGRAEVRVVRSTTPGAVHCPSCVRRSLDSGSQPEIASIAP